MCMLNPYCKILQSPWKWFPLAEEVGYVELQLRRIFKVPEWRKSRLWVKDTMLDAKVDKAEFKMFPDRSDHLPYRGKNIKSADSIVALEIAEPDGTWPSGYRGQPVGDFRKYSHLSKLHKQETWKEELKNKVETVFSGITGPVRQTVEEVVNTALSMVESQEKLFEERERNVTSKEEMLKKKEGELHQRGEIISGEEEMLEAERQTLRKETEKVKEDRERLEEEIDHMSKVHKTAEGRIQVDVGGIVYRTSRVTLTKDSTSMLGAMFSGRHEIKMEKDGSVFIDRDGTHFRYVLNYLREGGFRSGTLPEEHAFLLELLTEAEYYQISGLVDYLKETLQNFGHKSGPDGEYVEEKPRKKAKKH